MSVAGLAEAPQESREGSPRYPKHVTDQTIFADEFVKAYADNPTLHARRMGFFLAHKVNPMSVVGGEKVITVMRLGKKKVRVHYAQIVPGPDETEWGPSRLGGIPAPLGFICAYGSHKAAVVREVEATWAEVLL